MTERTITVIIPTCDRPDALAECLASLRRQTDPPQEVIVVNDGQSEVTAEGTLVLQTAGGQGAASARNRGVAATTADFLVFIDDDCEAAPDWLENLVAPLKEGADFSFGQTVYVSDEHTAKFPERLVSNKKGQWPGGANLAFCRNAFDRAGGFDDKFWSYHNEDTELAVRAITRGLHYARVPQAVVYHQTDRWSVRALLTSARNVSVWVRLRQKYPKAYREFGAPVWGIVVAPVDYLYLLGMPLWLPVAAVRYWWRGGRDWKIFFAKWPLWWWLRRWWVWREAWQTRQLMI